MNVQSVHYKNYQWLDLENPGQEEMEYLMENFPFHHLNLEDYQTKTQSPKLDLYRHYTLFVLDFPYISPQGNQILVSEVDFFLGDDYLVVLHEDKLPFLSEIFKRCQSNKKTLQRFLGKGPVFLFYRLTDILVDSSFSLLDKISSTTEQIDRDILRRSGKNIVGSISLQRRNIVIFQTIVKPAIPLFDRLSKGEFDRLNGEMQDYWRNLYDHWKKIWERLEDSRELIEGLSVSNESVLTYRTNEIVRFLTIITAIAFPFVIINNLYSMNIVGLPFAQHHFIVPILFGIILLSGLGIMAYFYYKRWL